MIVRLIVRMLRRTWHETGLFSILAGGSRIGKRESRTAAPVDIPHAATNVYIGPSSHARVVAHVPIPIRDRGLRGRAGGKCRLWPGRAAARLGAAADHGADRPGLCVCRWANDCREGLQPADAGAGLQPSD